jgi:NTE family protein
MEKQSDLGRALVLGSGGPLAAAWEIGVIKGLLEEGIDLSRAELIVGSSAGAGLGYRIASGQGVQGIFQSFAAQAPRPPLARPTRTEEEAAYFRECLSMWPGARDDLAQRRALGRRALEAPNPITQAEQVAFQRHALSLESDDWPERRLRVCAIDIDSGETRYFKREDGLPVSTALAASCSQPGLQEPISAGGRAYMDGGIAGSNVEVSDCVAVVFLGPYSGPPASVPAILKRQIYLTRDEQARQAIGANLFQFSQAPIARDEGVRQGRAAAEQVRAAW